MKETQQQARENNTSPEYPAEPKACHDGGCPFAKSDELLAIYKALDKKCSEIRELIGTLKPTGMQAEAAPHINNPFEAALEGMKPYPVAFPKMWYEQQAQYCNSLMDPSAAVYANGRVHGLVYFCSPNSYNVKLIFDEDGGVQEPYMNFKVSADHPGVNMRGFPKYYRSIRGIKLCIQDASNTAETIVLSTSIDGAINAFCNTSEEQLHPHETAYLYAMHVAYVPDSSALGMMFNIVTANAIDFEMAVRQDDISRIARVEIGDSFSNAKLYSFISSIPPCSNNDAYPEIKAFELKEIKENG